MRGSLLQQARDLTIVALKIREQLTHSVARSRFRGGKPDSRGDTAAGKTFGDKKMKLNLLAEILVGGEIKC